MGGLRIDDVLMAASQEPDESMAWPPYYRPNGRAARCGSAREWSVLPHGRTGRGTLRSRLSPLPSAKRSAPSLNSQPGNPRSDPAAAPCCQSNNTRRRCNRCLLPSYLTQELPRPCCSFAFCIPTKKTTPPGSLTITEDDISSRIPQSLPPPRHACPTRLPLFVRGPLPPAHPIPLRPSPPPDKPIPTSLIEHHNCEYSPRPPTPPTFTSRQPSNHCIAYFAVPIYLRIGGFE